MSENNEIEIERTHVYWDIQIFIIQVIDTLNSSPCILELEYGFTEMCKP